MARGPELREECSPSWYVPTWRGCISSAECVTFVVDESPYTEVRCAVANTDDPDMPVLTVRVWVLGLVWSIVVPMFNQYFLLRVPGVSLNGVSLFSSSP